MAKAKSTKREVTIELELTEREAELIGSWARQSRGEGVTAILKALETVGVNCRKHAIDWDNHGRTILITEAA